ncbi:hypothetical protein AMJ50_00770 [Parcubacteria bacterium DG_74_3]|nr:MAG: hypothetical protein AMJ50_00770 [Parcubacteria bacterium DG_74_3]
MYQTRDCGTCTYLEYQCIPNYPGCATSSPPVAIISCHPTGCENPAGFCTGYTKSNFCLKNESTDPDGVGDIENSIWTIKESTIIKDTSDCSLSGNPLCNWTLPAIFGAGNYQGELYVQDRHGLFATTTKTLTILQDTIADFECSLDNSNWRNCETLRPTIGEMVYFLDQSLPSQGATIIRRSWTFQNGNPASNVDNATNPSTRFQSTGGRTVTLTTTDSAGRIDSQSYIISVSISLPEWKEIPPL